MGDLQSTVSQHKRQFILFCIVGGVGVLVNMSVFALVLWALPKDALGPYTAQLATFPGWLVSVATNFVLNDRLTFAQHDFHHGLMQRLWRYYLGAASGYLLQVGILSLALLWLPVQFPAWPHLAGLPWPAGRKLLGNFLGIGVGTASNYLVARFWVFKKRAD